MKKPNLTSGKWKVVSRNTHKQYIAQLGIKTIVSDGNPDETEDADAKAIAQVPNMIDELIDAYYVMKAQVDSWGERRKHHDMYANMKSIEQVLIDAGCEEN